MMTGPSVGPGMLLTVLMRWPELIVVLAVGGSAVYAYKEYGLPESVEHALSKFQGKPIVKQQMISDSDKSKVVDHLPEATKVAAVPPEMVTFSKPVIEENLEPQIKTAAKYRVIEGDTLSKIAARRSNNPAVQRALINRMFNDNQHAFKNDDPNHLLADVEIIIPAK